MRSPRNYTIFPRTSRFHSALRLIINRQQLSQIRNDTYVISSQCWVITWIFIDFLAAPGYLLPTAMPVQASSTVQATTPFGDYLSHAFPRRPRIDAPGPFFVARAGAIVLQGTLLRHSHILRSGSATPSPRSLSSRGLSLRRSEVGRAHV